MKRKGGFLMALGLLMVLAAAVLTWLNLNQSHQAAAVSKEVVQALSRLPEQNASPENAPMPEAGSVPGPALPDYLRFPEIQMPTVHIDGQDYVATVAIPTLGLELPVISDWSYPALKIAPCCYKGSAYTGDLIIMAHNYDSHFGRIRKLHPGDLVTVTDMDGNLFSYQVAELEELPGNAVEDMESGIWDLTLFTCTYGGRSRITVRCDEITE